ncbi:MAG: zinc ribbon domain-containing protein [Desulfobacterales bacterium]|jgi:putative FmdB family regulatory protein
MPLYEYNCEKCNYKFDRLVMHMDTRVSCPICQGEVKKLMSTFSVGVPDNVADSLPPSMSPKMCTNC